MKTIKEIAKSHQSQMSSVHPAVIQETIEDAINEYSLRYKKSVTDEENCKHDWYEPSKNVLAFKCKKCGTIEC